MIQVVIPTMCLCPPEVFQYTLTQLYLSTSIEKIIIIDNSDDKLFKKLYEINEKIEVIENGKNIFVNPAWNMGLENVSSDYYIILNDDIAVHHYIFNVIHWVLKNHDDIGILTVKTVENMNLDEYKLKIEEIYNIKPSNVFTNKMLNPQGIQGWLMAGRKKEWKPVPEQLKIWYGDNYIFNNCRKNGLKALNLTSYFVNHYVSSTVSTKISPEKACEINKIIQYEKQLMSKYGNEILGK